MAFDGFVTRALVNELSNKLRNTKINKIHQPHKTDLVFNLRGFGESFSLLISANPTYPRINLTKVKYTNPVTAPMFCMLLRKHLESGVIEHISQVDNERIIHIDIKSKDEIGDIKSLRLIIEIMGKHSNTILINRENNMIIDGIKHVTAAISSYRQIYPGKEYISPPDQNKKNPFIIQREEFLSIINFNEGKLDKQLIENFTGMSPTIAREIVFTANLPTKENLWNSYNDIISNIKQNKYEPNIVIGKEKVDFSIIPITSFKGDISTFNTVNECIETFYQNKANRDTVKQKAFDLIKFLNTEKQKNQKKITALLKDLDKGKHAEKFKLYGELITANLFQINRGDKEAKVINYYTENQDTIVIPLDTLKEPNENAQSFFKKYNKLKNSIKFVSEQLEKTKEENNYLETVLTQLDNANVKDIEEIREELVEQGYLKNKQKKKIRKKKEPELNKFISSEGITIYVGKNNRQNEYLTHKVAAHFETWLHTKDIPGSHVVIKSNNFGEKTLFDAAMLAAFYSKAKNSSKVPVDYTLIKYVKKPNGSKPGFVIYENQKTIYVTPDEKIIKALEINKKIR